MGEYIDYKGKEVKLGTCESLYYTRLEQLEAAEAVGILEKRGGNLSASEYLDPANGFRYRFPFPEEDNIDIGDFVDYDKGMIVQLQHEDRDLVEDMEHGDIWHACHPKGGGYNVNIATPCPQSKELDWTGTQQPDNSFKRLSHSPIAPRIIEITQQKQVDGEIWTVIDCPYCTAKVRIEYESAVKLVHSIQVGYIETRKQDNEEICRAYYQTVCDRILAGYKVPVS